MPGLECPGLRATTCISGCELEIREGSEVRTYGRLDKLSFHEFEEA